MYARKNSNRWTLFLLLLAGMVLGSFAGQYLGQYSYLSWLRYGKPFGISPITAAFGVASVTFGLMLDINAAGLIGMLLAVVIYKLTNRL